MKLIIVAVLILSLSTFAHDEKKQREHGSHVHGHATLGIAFEKLDGTVEFKAASEGILGFEHTPKSAKDKKTLDDITKGFEANIATYIQFDKSANCTFTKKSIGMVKEDAKDTHSDFVAQFGVTCTKPLVGTSLVLDFGALNKLNEVDATILIDDLQLKSEIKTKKITIELKK